MVFSSLEFLLVFLPVFLTIYFITPDRYKNYTLLAGSLFFYAYGEPMYLLLMIFSILANYLLARLMTHQKETPQLLLNTQSVRDSSQKKHKRTANEKKSVAVRPKHAKLILIISLFVDFGLLFVFKYYDFFIGNLNSQLGYAQIPVLNLVLPLGISFYTFQITSYMIDVYKGDYPVEKNILKFATYVSMFPQLIAGPIVNYSEVREKLDDRKIKLENIESGVQTFIIGLCFKVLLANNIVSLWNDVETVGPYGISTGLAWLGSWGYAMQLYFDFCGYSLMAVGLGKIIGFEFPTNFNEPYTAVSLTDFWRRWHITLSRWFKNYVYIPLGGNRRSTPRNIFNLIAVWMLTGMWHGADWNFLIWGICTVCILIFEKYCLHKLLDKSRILGHMYMIILIPLLWTIFNISDLNTLGLYLRRLFFIPIDGGVASYMTADFVYKIKQYWWMLGLCILFATPYPRRLYDRFNHTFISKLMLLGLFWLCVYELVFGANNPFLYFRF